jgi:amino acid transporter
MKSIVSETTKRDIEEKEAVMLLWVSQWKLRVLGKPIPNELVNTALMGLFIGIVLVGDLFSSLTYGGESVMWVLFQFGRDFAHMWGMPVVVLISFLLLIIGISYTQLIFSFDRPGGAYVVAKKHMGSFWARTAAGGLLCDYLLTLTVSCSALMDALRSFIPVLQNLQLEGTIVSIILIGSFTLFGARRTGQVFAVFVYGFAISIAIVMGVGVFELITHTLPHLASVTPDVVAQPQNYSTIILKGFLVLVGFTAGMSGLTGAESVANSKLSLINPKLFGAIINIAMVGYMIIGLPVLMLLFIETNATPLNSITMLAQVVQAIFVGPFGLMLWIVQIFSALILGVAAVASLQGGPKVFALLAEDKQVPLVMADYGNNFVHEVSIVLMMMVSIGIAIVFDGQTQKMLPLYAIGVFFAFVTSQYGMYFRFKTLKERVLRFLPWQWSARLNFIGATACAVILLMIIVTKFTEGGWFTTVLIAALPLVFRRIQWHYENVTTLSQEGIAEKVEEIKKALSYLTQFPSERVNGKTHIVTIPGWTVWNLDVVLKVLQQKHDVVPVFVDLDPHHTQGTVTEIESQWKEAFGDALLLRKVTCRTRDLVPCLLNWVQHFYVDASKQGVSVQIHVVHKTMKNIIASIILHRNFGVRIRHALLHHPELRGRIEVSEEKYVLEGSSGSMFAWEKINPFAAMPEED